MKDIHKEMPRDTQDKVSIHNSEKGADHLHEKIPMGESADAECAKPSHPKMMKD